MLVTHPQDIPNPQFYMLIMALIITFIVPFFIIVYMVQDTMRANIKKGKSPFDFSELEWK